MIPTHSVLETRRGDGLYIAEGLYLHPHEAMESRPHLWRRMTRAEVLANPEVAELRAGEWDHIAFVQA